MNRSPTPDGMFAPHFVGVRWYFTECLLVSCGVFVAHFTDCSLAFHGMFVGILRSVLCVFRWCSQRYRNPSAAFWQTVRSRRGPIYRARVYVFATHSQSVQNTFT